MVDKFNWSLLDQLFMFVEHHQMDWDQHILFMHELTVYLPNSSLEEICDYYGSAGLLRRQRKKVN